MDLSLVLIVVGIVLAVLVPGLYGVGIVCVLVGLVLLVYPRLRKL